MGSYLNLNELKVDTVKNSVLQPHFKCFNTQSSDCSTGTQMWTVSLSAESTIGWCFIASWAYSGTIF